MVDVVRGRLPALKPDRPYSLGQLATAMGVSHRSMLRAVKTGLAPRRGGERIRLPGFRAGGAWRVMGADALAWLRLINEPREVAPQRAADYAGRLRSHDVDALLDAAGF